MMNEYLIGISRNFMEETGKALSACPVEDDYESIRRVRSLFFALLVYAEPEAEIFLQGLRAENHSESS
ncbi:MAG: hypothetical protein LBD68_11240 [Zoogloeaceae bacterium]|nr:hypothetical protein [Zoogloeaceae bacterium]